MRRLTVIILALLAVTLLVPQVVQAQAAPDTIEIRQATFYRDLSETGDFAALVHYNLAYATLPTDDADVNFLTRLLDGTTIRGTNVPYPYTSFDGTFAQGGYGEGVIILYFTAAQTLAFSWTDGAGAWTTWPMTTISVELLGNPTIFATIPTTTWSAVSGDFSTSSGQATNQSQLQAGAIIRATLLASAWGIPLLTDANLLNANDGTPYYTAVAPNIRVLMPNAFAVSTEAPNFGTPVPTPGGAGTYAATARDRYDAEDSLTPGFEGLSAAFGLPAGAALGLLVFIGLMAASVIGFRVAGGAGGMTGFGLGVMIIIPIAMDQGFMVWAFGALSLALISGAVVLKLVRDHF